MGVIAAQNGLLEDEIAYRLSLLATNVLAPLKAQYPAMIIRSGFRQSNSGAGQHEMGEAVDIQLKNQTTEILYECASWIRDTLAFDQLILNYTKMGDGLPWIHVSFSPTSLRGDVLTKDFADGFHEGLGFVKDYTVEEAAEINRGRAEIDAMILEGMTAMQARDEQSVTTTVVADELSDQTRTNITDEPRPEYVELITKIKDILWPFIGGLSDEEKAFQILIRVIWQLRASETVSRTVATFAPEIGFSVTPVSSRGVQLAEETEDFFINYNGPRGNSGAPHGGYNLSGQWVSYSNGQMYQILGPRGVFVPQWTAAPVNSTTTNLTSSTRWKPPIDPGDEFTTAWRSVTVGSTT